MTDYIRRADAKKAVYLLGKRPQINEVWDCLDALPSADAVPIHEDGTLEVKVPNAQKVGRVLVMDTDSHIGGGLFYPDDAVQGEWIKKQVFNPELDKYIPYIECSVCGYEPYYGGSESKVNYCANCGARMGK